MAEAQARPRPDARSRNRARNRDRDPVAAAGLDQRWPAARIEHWPLKKLLPYAKNPRTHSKTQVGQIAKAITEYGWTAPVLVDEAGGVLAGHGRILAAVELKLETIPTMVARGWTEAQKKAYRIWDNQSVLLGDWDN